jgi:hypothetical protein
MEKNTQINEQNQQSTGDQYSTSSNVAPDNTASSSSTNDGSSSSANDGSSSSTIDDSSSSQPSTNIMKA